jgi:hypothetical protein
VLDSVDEVVVIVVVEGREGWCSLCGRGKEVDGGFVDDEGVG